MIIQIVKTASTIKCASAPAKMVLACTLRWILPEFVSIIINRARKRRGDLT